MVQTRRSERDTRLQLHHVLRACSDDAGSTESLARRVFLRGKNVENGIVESNVVSSRTGDSKAAVMFMVDR